MVLTVIRQRRVSDPFPDRRETLERSSNDPYYFFDASRVTDYRVLYDRVTLDLGPSDIPGDVPTDIRVAEYGVKDEKLVGTPVSIRQVSAKYSEFPTRHAGSEFTGDSGIRMRPPPGAAIIR